MPIFFHKSISGITSADSLKGFTVGVKAGDACIDVLHTHGIESVKKMPGPLSRHCAFDQRRCARLLRRSPPGTYLLNQLGIEKDCRHSVPLYTGEVAPRGAQG